MEVIWLKKWLKEKTHTVKQCAELEDIKWVTNTT